MNYKNVSGKFLEALYCELKEMLQLETLRLGPDEEGLWDHTYGDAYEWALGEIDGRFVSAHDQSEAEDILSDYASLVNSEFFKLGCRAVLSYVFVEHLEMIDIIRAHLQCPKTLDKLLNRVKQEDLMPEKDTAVPLDRCADLSSDLVRRRKALGMTQQELADKTGVGRTTVTMWETGAGNPRIQVLPALARALQCTVDELLGAEVSKE